MLFRSIAKKLGITNVYSELLPDGKVNEVSTLINEDGKHVLFVGDGINDAPVLAMSDVGVAMGGIGSDAAIEAADVVLMNDEPSKICTGLKISKITRKIVTENIMFSLGVKLIILVLVAFGLSNLWLAIFADVGVALIAIFNSLRILGYRATPAQ